MNTHLKHLLQMAAAILAVLAAMVLATILIDPYRVFGVTSLNRKNFMPNIRFLQVEHLKENSYEAFVLGTSRVNFYDVADVGALTGLSAYNLTMPAGTLREARLEIEWLLKHQKPRLVVLGLDYDIQFFPAVPEDAYLRKWLHYEVTGTPRMRFWLEYLRFDVESIWLAVKRNFLEWKTTWLFHPSTGHYSLPKRDADMAGNWAAYEAAQFQPLPPSSLKAQAVHEGDLRQIVTLLQKNGIPAVYLINPVHAFNMASFDAADFEGWKKRMNDICGRVHDFSAEPTICHDNRLFYEHMHFRAEAGRRVLEKVLKAPTR